MGHETTGATTYNEQDIKNLLAWIDTFPQKGAALTPVSAIAVSTH